MKVYVLDSIETWNEALELAARIAEDPKWAADPRAVSCDQPRSIALQIRELMK